MCLFFFQIQPPKSHSCTACGTRTTLGRRPPPICVRSEIPRVTQHGADMLPCAHVVKSVGETDKAPFVRASRLH